MKKLLISMMAMLLPLAASAYDVCIDGIYYNVVKDVKQATVTYGNSVTGTYSGDIVIPNTIVYNGVICNVITIGENAFSGCENLISVEIPNSITSIEYKAFNNCGSIFIIIKDVATWCGIETSYYTWEYTNYRLFTLNGEGNREEIKSMSIPHSVTRIGSYIFSSCLSLTSVNISENITAIGQGAFYCCSNLSSVYIGDGVTSIGASAFCGCRDLSFVNIGNNVIDIGGSAFSYCGLTSIIIPNSVKTIGNYAFTKCTQLTNVSIGNAIQTIGDGAFNECSGIENVYITDIAAWCNIDFWTTRNMGGMTVQEHSRFSNPLHYAKHLFLNGEEITELEIPSYVKSISMQAFNYFSGLISVVIPDGMKFRSSLHSGWYYEEEAGPFSRCPNLKSISIGNDVIGFGINNCDKLSMMVIGNQSQNISVTSCKELVDVFCVGSPVTATFSEDCQINNATLHVPAGVWFQLYKEATPWNGFGTITTLKEGDPLYVKPVGSKIDFADIQVAAICLFNWDNNLDGQLSKTEAAAVTDIGTLFKENKTITSFDELRFFTGLTSIPNWAFYQCENLVSFILPNQVTSIGESAFGGCLNLESIPNLINVKNIGMCAFSGCKKVSVLDFPEGMSATFGQSAFSNMNIDCLTFPNSFTSIDDDSFSNTKVKKLVLSPGVQTLGSRNFALGIDEIHISDFTAWCKMTFNYTDYDEWVFKPHRLYLNGTILKDIVIPDEVFEIGSCQFTGLSDITSVTLHNNITAIGRHAFLGCTNIKELTIPENVNTISDEAFYGLTNLEKVTSYINYPTSIPYNTFLINSNTNPTATLYVPNGTKTKYQSLSGWNKFDNIVEMDGPAVIIQLPVNETYFPDENFRNYLLTLTNYVKNGIITDVSKITSLSCSNKQIESLKGIEYFPKLKNLYCNNNLLISLDVSQNPHLEYLSCNNNLLTSLDVLNNNTLKYLYCNNNKLTVLNVSMNPALKELDCFVNQLVSLDVLSNPALTYLRCGRNKLTTLDISNNASLTNLDCFSNLLTALDVSNNTALVELNSWANSIKRVEMGKLVQSLPTVTEGNFYVKNFNYSDEHDEITKGQVAAARAKGWTVLAYFTKNNQWGAWDYEGEDVEDIDLNDINFPDAVFREYVSNTIDTNLDGKLSEEEIAGVTTIYAESKGITNLKGIEYFTAVTYLSCGDNQLTSLDVSKNTALKYLYCHSNQLTSLDVSKNSSLTKFSCGDNQLTSLDVSKNTALMDFNCQANQLTSLDVTNNTALTRLICNNNQLTSLDVSKNATLTYLHCYNNQLTSLDVSKNTTLTILSCDDNQLTLLDVSKNTLLTDLSCYNNQLTSLDLSKNTTLTILFCAFNQLTSFDVSKNTALTHLGCNNNLLTSLDLSKNTELTRLYCYNNKLTSLDLSNNTLLTYLGCYQNKIGETAMGNLVASLPTSTNGEFYVIDTAQGNEQNVITKSQVTAAKAKGWTVYDFHNGSSVEYAGSAEQTPGDLNDDGIINGIDLVAQTNLIMTDQYNAVADLNNDGFVNGLDYVIMVNMIMSFTSAPAMQAAGSNRVAATSSLSIEDFDIKAGETKELFINLSNPNTDLTLLQFDMRLPEGLSIATEDGDYAIDIAGRTTWKKHSLMAKATNGITRFLLASNSNALIDGDNGNVISIRLTASDGFTCGDIMLENQLLVSPDAEDVMPADYIYSVGGTTSIDAMGSKVMQLEGVYDLQGRRVKAEANSSLFTLHSSLMKGVYIVNGKKIIVK